MGFLPLIILFVKIPRYPLPAILCPNKQPNSRRVSSSSEVLDVLEYIGNRSGYYPSNEDKEEIIESTGFSKQKVPVDFRKYFNSKINITET